jgi:hypothetical protein
MTTGMCRIMAVIIEVRDGMSTENTGMKVIRAAAAMIVVIKGERIVGGI